MTLNAVGSFVALWPTPEMLCSRGAECCLRQWAHRGIKLLIYYTSGTQMETLLPEKSIHGPYAVNGVVLGAPTNYLYSICLNY